MSVNDSYRISNLRLSLGVQKIQAFSLLPLPHNNNKADFIKHINVCKHSALQVNHTVPSATQCVEMTPQVNHTVPSATQCIEMTPQVNHTVPSATQCVEMTPQVNHTVPSATQCVEMTPQVNHTVPSASQCVEMIIVESLCTIVFLTLY